MENMADFGSRLFLSHFQYLFSVYLKHPHRDRVSHSFLYHGVVFTEAIWVCFRSAGPYTVAYAQIHQIPYVINSNVGNHSADRRERNLLGIGEEHMPAD